jgi:hypothetical protein
MPFTNDQRAYPTGSSLLELSGTFAGQVRSTEGGDAISDVIQQKLGSDPVVRKHLAGVRYTDIKLECDARMERNFFDWIRDTLNHRFTRKSGAISFPDFHYQVDSRVEFADALLTGVSFPALDAGSRDAVTMTVKLTPEYTRRQKGSGQLQSAPGGLKGRGGWTAANFRLQIDGLDCKRVSKIEPLIFTTVVAEEAVGELRDYQKEPAQLDVPDLVITVPESEAASFYAWHEDFVIKGMNGPQYEKNGTLEFLGPNEKDTLLTLELKNLGIYRLAPVKPSVTGGIARVSAAMYCEEITLAADGIAPPGSSPSAPSQVVAAPVAVAAAPAPVAAPAAATAAPGANGGEPTPMIIAREPGELMRIRPADVQTEPVDVPTDDGVGTSAYTATSLGTIPPGTSKTFSGARGPSKPAWFHVTMPCSDSCTARLQMTGGPAFDLYSSPQTPLARGLTLGDVFLSPTLTQLLVNVPEGPWARYTLAIFR